MIIITLTTLNIRDRRNGIQLILTLEILSTDVRMSNSGRHDYPLFCLWHEEIDQQIFWFHALFLNFSSKKVERYYQDLDSMIELNRNGPGCEIADILYVN